MKAVIQRVSEASVEISGAIKGKIDTGLLILLGIESDDTHEDAEWLAAKIVNMRIFGDENLQMNLDIKTIAGDLLIISQFTLHAHTKKGNRPSFIKAARPEKAIPLYQHFIQNCEALLGKKVQTGEFGAEMKVRLLNDGPVTIIIDSKNKE